MKKYELDKNDSIEINGRILYRVIYTDEFIDKYKEKYGCTIQKKGGYIESETNLSQDGYARVINNAVVSGDASINDKGVEKYLSQEWQDCESGVRIFSNARIKMDIKCRLELMIDYCVAMRSLGGDEKLTNRLFAVIDTLYCLGIIDDDESTDYIARLNGVKK